MLPTTSADPMASQYPGGVVGRVTAGVWALAETDKSSVANAVSRKQYVTLEDLS